MYPEFVISLFKVQPSGLFFVCSKQLTFFCDKNNTAFNLLLIVYNTNQTSVCNKPLLL